LGSRGCWGGTSHPDHKGLIMKTTEIILCVKCKGAGTISYEELIDYHKREYTTIEEVCNSCGGSGRMKKITEVTYEKFN
jgi:DnaJ-class molecular chaperone